LRVTEPARGLEALHLHLWRGDRHVLKGLSFSVAPGELVHVRGPNGVGKTSLLRTLAGFLYPEEGEVRWQGQRIDADRDGYSSALAYLGHDNGLKSDLTARENLHYALGLRHAVAGDALDSTLIRLGVGAVADLPVRSLSAGQRRRVALARVALGQASLWLLDEPFTNLDAAGAAAGAALLNEHAAAGGLALLTAHGELDSVPRLRRLELQ
jgi:heme exporter protein A